MIYSPPGELRIFCPWIVREDLSMGTFFRRTFAAAASLVLVGCAAGTPGTLQTTPIALAEPSAGAGQIVFFRPAAFVGAAVGCTVREDGRMIVRIEPGRYYVAPVGTWHACFHCDDGSHRHTEHGSCAE